MDTKIIKFQRELGEIRQDLLHNALQPQLDDTVSYRMATKIDLTVSRLLRLMESRYHEERP